MPPIPQKDNPMKKFDKSIRSETTKQSEVVTVHSTSSRVNELNEEAVEMALRKQLRRIVLPKPLSVRNQEAPPKDLKSVVDRIGQKMAFLTSQMKLER